jgi:GNAT superfamily N-acetyltransferase
MRLLNKTTGRFVDVGTARLAVALIRSDEYMYVNDAPFLEADHPRDADGKFASTGSSSTTTDITPTDRAQAPYSVAATSIPHPPEPPKAKQKLVATEPHKAPSVQEHLSGKFNLSNVISEVKNKGVDLDVREYEKELDLAQIKVPTKLRNKGLAKEAINKVKDYANKINKPVKLLPNPLDSKTDYDRLVKFYESLGFEKKEPTGKPEKIGNFTKFQPTYWVYEPKKN